MILNLLKLVEELNTAGIPYNSVMDTGEINFKPEATTEQKKIANGIVNNHNPYDYVEERRNIYPPLGDQLDHLFWALKQLKDSEMKDWDGIDEWFRKLQKIKDRFPKA